MPLQPLHMALQGLRKVFVLCFLLLGRETPFSRDNTSSGVFSDAPWQVVALGLDA